MWDEISALLIYPITRSFEAHWIHIEVFLIFFGKCVSIVAYVILIG